MRRDGNKRTWEPGSRGRVIAPLTVEELEGHVAQFERNVARQRPGTLLHRHAVDVLAQGQERLEEARND